MAAKRVCKEEEDDDEESPALSVPFRCTFSKPVVAKLLDHEVVAAEATLDSFSGPSKKGSLFTDPTTGVQSFLPTSVWATGAPYQWKDGNRGQGVRIAVLDTGIDSLHPALAGRVVESYDFVGDGVTDPRNFNIHGTHVAGTIAACGDGLLGVAPEVSLLDYRVLGVNGSGSFKAIAAAIRHAAKRADIISMSLGAGVPDPDVEAAVKYAVKTKNRLVLAAAGNEQNNSASPSTIPQIGYPAYYSETVSVGAVEYNDGKVTRAYFSNVNREVDLCTDGYEVVSSVPGGGYAVLSGTSMATPVAAGFAALLLTKARSVVQGTPFVSEIELYSMLKAHTVNVPTTSTPLGNEDPTLLGLDWLYGAGFATFHAAIPVKTDAGFVIPDLTNGAPA